MMNHSTSIEERMDLERVSETELANVLYVCKVTIDTIKAHEGKNCGCDTCMKKEEEKEKILKLRLYKKKLGLMSYEEQFDFDRALRFKETNLKMIEHLESFYAKMSPHLSNERRLEIESNLDF